MTQKPTKRSHTVQKGYLKFFSTKPEEENPRVMVFDKKRGNTYTNSVENITVENNFYKIPLEFVEGFVESFPEYEDFFTTDFVEKFFNINFETPYLKVIKEFFSSNYPTGSLLEHSPFKVVVSAYIAIQYMRTRNIRTTMEGTFSSFQIEKEYHPLLHFIYLLNDSEKLKSVSTSIYERLWTVYVNETSVPFKTSDNPVVITEGNELVFPISSKHLIYIKNEKFNDFNIMKDLKLESLLDPNKVNYFNYLQEQQCDSQVIWEGDGTL